MKIQTRIVTLVMSCVSGLAFNIAINQSAIAQTATQRQKLKAVGIPVVMPTYVPSGFRLTNFKIDITTSRDNPQGIQSSYDATYKGPNNCEIGVSGANGGWGAPGPVREWTVNTQLFGKVILEEWDGSVAIPPVPNYLIAGILPNPDSTRGVIKGFPLAGYIFSFSCRNSVFSHQTASRILQSARIVK